MSHQKEIVNFHDNHMKVKLNEIDRLRKYVDRIERFNVRMYWDNRNTMLENGCLKK